MLLYIIGLMFLVIMASVLQKSFKIPSPISLMAGVLAVSTLHGPVFNITDQVFDILVVVTLPLLIAADSLKLCFNDLVKNWVSLLWVAVISVVLSVGAGVLMADYVFPNQALPIAAIVMLFCMVSATDPITVSAIFSNVKVPHQLKVLTEGESLFNDATALIIFSLALASLTTPDMVTGAFIATKTVSVLVIAVIVGVVIGAITMFVLRLSNEALVEATILLLAAYSSYEVAEHFHASGILAVIVSMVMANKAIQDIIREDNEEMNRAEKNADFGIFKYAITDRENHAVIIRSVDFLSLFAAALLFIAVASIVDIEKMWMYRGEILAVFVASTIIRGVMMLKFAFVSNKVDRMQSIQPHWWAVLTFAGSKGALSLLMVHMIPSSFAFKEMFEHIIVGNILLSTFLYAGILATIIRRNKAKFELECQDELHS